MANPLTVDWYRCQECQSPLIDAPSGSVCPHGHGMIYRKLPPQIKRRNHAIVALGLKDILKLPNGQFAFEPGGQLYERVPNTINIARLLNEWPEEVSRDETLAIIDGTMFIRLQPITKK